MREYHQCFSISLYTVSLEHDKILVELKGLLRASSNVVKFASKFNDGMTQHTGINSKLLSQLLNCRWVGVKVHQPVAVEMANVN